MKQYNSVYLFDIFGIIHENVIYGKVIKIRFDMHLTQ